MKYRVNKNIVLDTKCESYVTALSFYEDKDTLLLINGNTEPYTFERLMMMYENQRACQELYFIYYNGKMIGDVGFSNKDIPIVILPEFRGKGIATAIIEFLIKKAQKHGYKRLEVEDIYNYNIASKRLFESFGFKPFKKTDKGYSYFLEI